MRRDGGECCSGEGKGGLSMRRDQDTGGGAEVCALRGMRVLEWEGEGVGEGG